VPNSCGNPLSCLNNWNCYYSNLNSLVAKFDELLTNVLSGSPHIVLVTETWLSEYHDDSLVNLPGYTVYRRDRVGSRGGGVCVYLMDSVFCQFKVNILPCTFHSSEGIFLLITLNNFSLVIGCVYRPPNSLIECDHEIFLFLTNLFLKYKNVIVAGDFNLPNLTWPLCFDSRFSSAGAPLVDFLLNTHATQFVQECTRFRSGQNPSLLDLILISNPDLATNLNYLPPVGKSDHVLLEFNIQVAISISPKKTSVTKTFLDFDKLNHLLSSVDWENELSSDSLDDNWLKFRNMLLIWQIKCSVSKTYITNPSKPWLNPKIFALIGQKKSLWQKFRRSLSIEDYESHRKLSNTLSKQIKLAKKGYEERIVNSDNSKSLFKFVRRVLAIEAKEFRLKRADDTLTTSDYETANLFAHTFSHIYNHTLSQSKLPDHEVTPGRIITDVSFDRESILRKLQTIKPTACPGPDNISPSILRNCSHPLSFPLSLLMEQSFHSSTLPCDWRTAYITPIHKSGNRLEANNYRPISLTSSVVKIMESIIVDRLDSFTSEFAIIPKEQYGFTKGKSVETNLLSCLNDWSSLVDLGKSVDVVYLDFAKAFDKVPINLLITKLKTHGISGRLLAWITHFLSDRKFAVKVNGVLSDFFDVLSGVPQGSVLGPKLFLLYTADIPDLFLSPCAMFADDIKLYNDTDNSFTLQEDLNKVLCWSESWGLPLKQE
jgi:hypothetical protein